MVMMKEFFKQTGTDLVVQLPTELDHYYAEIIKKRTDQIIQEKNIKRIIFDFRNTEFMDSSGIGLVIGRYKNMCFMGGEVIAIHVSRRIYKILQLSGIRKIIKISVQDEK